MGATRTSNWAGVCATTVGAALGAELWLDDKVCEEFCGAGFGSCCPIALADVPAMNSVEQATSERSCFIDFVIIFLLRVENLVRRDTREGECLANKCRPSLQ
jgi:hypothetical protein